MLSSTSSCKRSAAATAFSIGCITVAMALYPAEARSGSLSGVAGAVGNTVGAVAGAVGNIAGTAGSIIGGTGTSGSGTGTSGSGTGTNSSGALASGGGASRAGTHQDAIRSGNWINAPFILKKNARSETEAGCKNTFADYDRSYACENKPSSRRQASLDRASYSDDNEAVVPKTVRKSQAPGKVGIPKRVARLNVESPALGNAEPAVAPKSVQSRRKVQPKLLSCDKGGTIVGSYGFVGVNPSDCDGQVLAFNASRDGKSYLITLNATSGELIKVSKLAEHTGLKEE